MCDHGWSHVALNSMSAWDASQTLVASARRLQDMTGQWPLWYRSPYLGFGPLGAAETSAAGLLYGGMSASPKDYLAGTTSAKVVSRLEAEMRPGAVIDLHVTRQTIDAMPLIAEMFKRRGYTALTMSQLATVGPPATSVAMLWQRPTTCTTPAVPAKPKAGHLLSFSGVVKPSDGRKVEVQIRRYGKHGTTTLVWRKKVTPDSMGRWSVRTRLKKATYRIRVVAPGTDMYRANVSAWVKFAVR